MNNLTAAEAIEWLTSDKAFGQECYSRKQIAALIEQQAAEIAAANAELVAEKSDHEKAESELLNQVTKINALMLAERREREQAEAQCAAMRDEIRKITKLHQGREFSYSFVEAQKIAMDILTGQTVSLRKTAILAENKRMREALEEIASFDGWKSDIAKSALEEKP